MYVQSEVQVRMVWDTVETFPAWMVDAVAIGENGIVVILRTGEVIPYLANTIKGWHAPARKIRAMPPDFDLDAELREFLYEAYCDNVCA